jgi:hypothetical protein
VESPLSKKLIRSEFKAGDRLQIDVENGELVFRKLESKAPAAVAA